MNTYFRRNRRSWHRYVTFTRAGTIVARCGRRLLDTNVEWTDKPPLNEKGCEVCSRLALRDIDPRDVDNDPVPG